MGDRRSVVKFRFSAPHNEVMLVQYKLQTAESVESLLLSSSSVSVIRKHMRPSGNQRVKARQITARAIVANGIELISQLLTFAVPK